MKTQEAINILEKYKSVPKSEVVKTAYEMAISALEKQIEIEKNTVYAHLQIRQRFLPYDIFDICKGN